MNKQEFKIKKDSEKVYEDLPGIVINNRVYILETPIRVLPPPTGLDLKISEYRPTEELIRDGCNCISVCDYIIDSNASTTEIEETIINFVKKAKEYDLRIGVVTNRIFMMISIPILAYFIKYCLEMDVSIKIIQLQPVARSIRSINMEKELIELIDDRYIDNGYVMFGTPTNVELSDSSTEFGGFPCERWGFIPISSYKNENIDGTDDHTFAIVENVRNLKKLGLGLSLVHAHDIFDTIYCMKVCSFFEVPLKICIPKHIINEEQDCIIDVIPKEKNR